LHPRPKFEYFYNNLIENVAQRFFNENFIRNKLSSSADSNAILILPEREKEEDLPESLPALLVDLSKNSIAWLLINTFT